MPSGYSGTPGTGSGDGSYTIRLRRCGASNAASSTQKPPKELSQQVYFIVNGIHKGGNILKLAFDSVIRGITTLAITPPVYGIDGKLLLQRRENRRPSAQVPCELIVP